MGGERGWHGGVQPLCAAPPFQTHTEAVSSTDVTQWASARAFARMESSRSS